MIETSSVTPQNCSKMFVNLSNMFGKIRIVTLVTFFFSGLGRCKSTFHQFLTDTMERVKVAVANLGEQPKTMFLPHCTWDKFGEILANAGGRSFGLFDELTSFFSTMNMYSSVKMQISDTKEYQDFLQLFTGKSKTRETSKFNVEDSNTALTMYNT